MPTGTGEGTGLPNSYIEECRSPAAATDSWMSPPHHPCLPLSEGKVWGTMKGDEDLNWLVVQRWREVSNSKFEGEFRKVALLCTGDILSL